MDLLPYKIPGNSIPVRAYISPAHYKLNISDRPNHGDDIYNRLKFAPPRNDTPEVDAFEKNFISKRIEKPSSTQSERRVLETQMKLSSVEKNASSGFDVIKGVIAGGALGLGTSKALSHILPNKALDSTGIVELIGSNASKDLAKSVQPELNKQLGKYITPFGMVAGGLGGLVASGKKKQQESDYPVKTAEDQHFFITGTGVTIMPPNTMPKDIEGAVNLQHPFVKYLPMLGAGAGAGASALYDIIKRKPLNYFQLSSLAGAGAMTGSTLHNNIESHYARPYLESYAKGIDRKYKDKEASNPLQESQTEYISETGVDVYPKSVGPKDLETAITFKHPYLQSLPLLGMSAGTLLGNSLKSRVITGTIGATLGHLARLALMEHHLKPYRKKYVEAVKNKYGV